MKKKISIIQVIVLFVVILFVLTGCNDKTTNQISTVTQIELDLPQYINQLEEVKIDGTDDTIMITKEVKWEVPEHEENETVSFSIQIPYTITVDGIEYYGVYELGDYPTNSYDNNPKYNIEIKDLTKNGDVKIIITNK